MGLGEGGVFGVCCFSLTVCLGESFTTELSCQDILTHACVDVRGKSFGLHFDLLQENTVEDMHCSPAEFELQIP